MRGLLTVAGLLTGLVCAAQGSLPLYRDIDVTSVNADTRRTEVIMYPSEKEALALPFEKSPFYLDLNGSWDFLYFDSEKDIPAQLEGWGKIAVPGNWEFQGHGEAVYVNHPYEFKTENPQPPELPDDIPVGFYRRSFTVPAGWEGREVYLNLCGVKSGVYTFVNGEEVGYSEDSKDLARFDITPYLKEGENELMLKCWRWSTGSYLECQDFWRVSGIERDVYLSSESTADRMDFEVLSTLDTDMTTGLFRVDVSCSLPVSYVLYDAAGTVVARGDAASGTVRIPEVKQWSAEIPNLYTLVLKAGEEFTRFDVGFRRLEIRDGLFLVNGMPVKFKGVNMHEHNEFTGHWCDREYLRKNLLLMKSLNINAVRTCHYPQSRAFYELCDSIGIYVYDEANIESHGMYYGEKSLAKKPEWFAKHRDRFMNMYMRTRNYPCVTILSLGNEAGNGVNFERIYDEVKLLEKDRMNRPICYERSLFDYNTDMIVPQYPGADWFREMGEKYHERPVCPSEYSHAMGNSSGSLDLQWEQIYSYPQLQGGFIWDWIDQGVAAKDASGKAYWKYGGDFQTQGKSPERWYTDRNFCCNGIVGPDLDPHPAAAEVKWNYRNVCVERVSENQFRIFNRFYFRTLHGLTEKWEITSDGKPVESGTLSFSCPPQTGEEFSLALPGMDDGHTWYLNFSTLDGGEVIAHDQFLLQKASRPLAAEKGKVKVRVKGGSAVVRARGAKFAVNLETGVVTSYRLGWKNVILKDFGLRPEFWRAPVDNDWGDGMPLRCAAWKDSITVLGSSILEDGIHIKYGLPGGCVLDVDYRLAASGALRLDAAFTGSAEKRTELPRLGFRTRLKASADRFRYFGRGPQENYCDRFMGTPVGLYESRASEEFYPYVRPQETGHHTGCEWLEIGPVRVFSAGGDFEFNALRCSIEDLDPREADGSRAWGHVNDIKTRPYVELCLDFGMTGVGGYDSWGSRPEESRTLFTDMDYDFNLTILRK